MAISKDEASRIERAATATAGARQKIEDLESRLEASRTESTMARQAFDTIAVRRELGEGADEAEEARARSNRDRAAERVEAVIGALNVARERLAKAEEVERNERLAARWGEAGRIADRLRRDRAEIVVAANALHVCIEKYRAGMRELAAVSPRTELRRDLSMDVSGGSAARIAAVVESAVHILRRNSAAMPGFDHEAAVAHHLGYEDRLVRLFGSAVALADEAPTEQPSAPEKLPSLDADAETKARRLPAPSDTPRIRLAGGIARGMDD